MSNINSTTAPHQLQSNGIAQQKKKTLKYISAPFQFIYYNLFTISVIAVLLFGWANRDDNYLSAENGAGYALGIIGGSMMLLLLLYPLSKRISVLSRLVPVRYWFGIHMFFGIVGPVMVLFHSNFHLGSTNSSIALFSMLLVAVSGLIGRYIYTNIHHGLYGKRITLGELKHELESKNTELLYIYKLNANLNKLMSAMEDRALKEYTGITRSLLDAVSLSFNARRLETRLMRMLNSTGNNDESIALPDQELARQFINRYTTTLRKIVAFRIYERLFSLWHILHMPLFIMMIITAVIHIFAVHMY